MDVKPLIHMGMQHIILPQAKHYIAIFWSGQLHHDDD